MKRTPEASHDALRQWKNSKAFHDLCLTLQLAFVVPSDELLAVDYLRLKSAPSSTGYHVPPKVLEQSRLLLRPGTYQEIVEERAALKLCGYPGCSSHLDSVPDPKKVYFRLNLSKKEISEERASSFCGKDCHRKSLQFERSLEDVAIKYNSHSVEELKQALQIITGWYHCKLHLVMPSNSTIFGMGAPSDGPPPSSSSSRSSSKVSTVNPLDKMVENLRLEIVEKNVARNLHQNDPNTNGHPSGNAVPKKKWKRPSPTKRPRRSQPKRTTMDIEADDSKTTMATKLRSKTAIRCEPAASNEPLTRTAMEELFQTAQREKKRMEMERAEPSKWSKDTMDDVEMEDVECVQSANGRTVKMCGDLSEEELAKMEEDKLRQIQEERTRIEYAAMSANAQLMGQYIGWCTDATSDFVMKREAAYLKWKEIAMRHYNEMFSAPKVLRERQDMLMNNVMKYVEGLLAKFGVNATLNVLIGREMRSLVETFDIKEGIPAFTPKTWCFIAFVFLKLVSHRIGDLKREMFGKKDRVEMVLGTIGFGQEYVITFEEIVVFD